LRTFNTESPGALIHEIVGGSTTENTEGKSGGSSRALLVLREFSFVLSVLKFLSSMTEQAQLNKITESDVTAFKEHSV
jgi:hypothetical protein